MTHYYVVCTHSGSNSLTHAFMYCRWKMVVHGGVDGYSRVIVYLKCSNDNRAETVLQLFRKLCLHMDCLAVSEVTGAERMFEWLIS